MDIWWSAAEPARLFSNIDGDTSVMKAISVVMILKEIIDGLGALLEEFRLDGRQLSYERSTLIYEIP